MPTCARTWRPYVSSTRRSSASSLVATWAEQTDLFGKLRTYAHCFFDIGDGSCLAFFQFADEDDQAEFGPELPPSGFRHLAMKVDQETQDAIKERLEAAGYFESGEAYP
jgi:glyoxylase I family protein